MSILKTSVRLAYALCSRCAETKPAIIHQPLCPDRSPAMILWTLRADLSLSCPYFESSTRARATRHSSISATEKATMASSNESIDCTSRS